MNPASQPNLLPPPAKFKRSKFGAPPNSRRITFAFNAVPSYGTMITTQGDANAVGGLIWHKLGAAGWNILDVAATARTGFYSVVINANVANSFDWESAGRALTDNLGNDYSISNFVVTDSGVPQNAGGGSGFYTVVAGDTLSKIAARYGTTWQALQALNNLPNPNLLEIGQVIKIAGSPSSQPPPQNIPPQGGSTAPPVVLGEAKQCGAAPDGMVYKIENGVCKLVKKNSIEGWAATVGISVSALALLGVVATMVVSSRRN